MIQNCAITLQGFVQKVCSGVIYTDSRRSRYIYGDRTTSDGLPGEDSYWCFDYGPLGPGPYFCVRVLESKGAIGELGVIYYLILLEDNSTKALGLKNLGEVYTRVGILHLEDVPAEYLAHPYSDVKCKNGKALLTDGEWKDVVLL